MTEKEFYYEVSEEAQVAVNTEGVPQLAYIRMTLEGSEKDLNDHGTEESVRQEISKQTGVALEHLTQITKEAYDKQQEAGNEHLVAEGYMEDRTN